jgi:hypothetical protein
MASCLKKQQSRSFKYYRGRRHLTFIDWIVAINRLSGRSIKPYQERRERER